MANLVLVKKDGIDSIIHAVRAKLIPSLKSDIAMGKFIDELIVEINKRGVRNVNGVLMASVTKQEIEKLQHYYELPF